MKACKIILIVILVLRTIVAIIDIFAKDGNEQVEAIGKVLIGVPISWLLYWGAGIFDL